MQRRQFIGLVGASAAMGAGAAVSAVSWPRAASARGMRTRAASTSLAPPADLVIYDERYPDAERFAAKWQQAGTRVLATSGEIVTLWHEQVAGSFGSGTPKIIGLTLHSDFEIVRVLASGHRLRVLQKELRAAQLRAGTLTLWRLGS